MVSNLDWGIGSGENRGFGESWKSKIDAKMAELKDAIVEKRKISNS